MASIRKLDSGSWQAQVRLKGHSPVSKTFKTKAEAQHWAKLKEKELRQTPISSLSSHPTATCIPPQASPVDDTLGYILTRYLSEVSSKKKSHDSEKYRIKLLVSRLGHLKASEVTPKDIATYRDSRLSQVSTGTVRRELILLGHVFEVSRIDWGITLACGNPLKDLRKPVDCKPRTRRLTPGELERLLKYLHGDTLAIVKLALETGMRRSELVNIEWSGVDLKARTVHLQDTKNGDSRDIPLSSKAIEILQNHPKSSYRVFTIRESGVTQAFKKACRKARIENLRFHDLRHEAISRLFELGKFNVMEVSAISGHKTLGMLKRYTHLKASDLALRLA